MRKNNYRKTPCLRFATWNVRTMCPGFSTDIQQVEDVRKTAIIDKELSRLKVDIACLQETRLADSGTLREDSYTFFWQGKPLEEPRQHGVGFAVKNTLISSIETPTAGTERILSLRLSTSLGPATIVSVYAPTLRAAPEVKDQFYEALDELISRIPSTDALYLLGDFNARVGADHEAWPSCLGAYGRGKINDNGQRLLELCCYRSLCVTNTFFPCKEIHQVSWRHPRSRHWHQLDLVITRRSDLASILLTRTYHSADCNTDHSLVASKVRITPQKLHHGKKKGRPRVNTCCISNCTLKQQFLEQLMVTLAKDSTEDSTDSKWAHLRDTVYSTAINVYGKKERKNADWFEEHWAEMEPVTERKRKALLAYKASPSPTTLAALRAARKTSRQTARQCANTYWLNLCKSIQAASDTGNVRGMYEGIKKATGPAPRKSAPLKAKSGEVITDQAKQLDRWVEHYLELYATLNIVSDAALADIPDLPVMEELDAPPTEEELSNAINSLAGGKAPGSDNIPAEILKSGKPALLKPLLELLCRCWEEGHIPQDLRDSTIVTLYKNKGDRSDCNNYRGISLLSIVGKVFARVILARLQTLASRVYPESQCGFRAGRSTVDMVFSLRQLQEKCQEQQKPLYIAFIDLTKAFDLVSRSGLFKLLEKIGCPPHLLAVIASFHDDMHSTVSFNGATSEAFPVSSGVKQGCVLAPTLFGIFFSMLLQYAFKDCEEGVYIHTRADGGLFNIARLRAKTKVLKVLIRDLLFADDAALVSHTEDGLQHLVNRFSHACKEFGLTISLKKTEVMGQGTEHPPTISIDGHMLAAVETFTYLGSNISSSFSLDTEISSRIAKAAVVMSKLHQRVWSNSNLTEKTKLRVYEACVLSTLLYSSEAWTPYARQEKRLQSFHLRCLRRILSIRWQDKISDVEVLKRAGLKSMVAILRERRLRWLGHVHRMDCGRIPKDLLYGELAEGTRPIGRPRLRFKDVCKKDMQQCKIDVATWESLAGDRSSWRRAVKSCVQEGENARNAALTEKRERRKNKQQRPQQPSNFVCSKCNRDCHSRIGLYSHSRRCRR